MDGDDEMSQNLDGSNWDGPGGSGGQNGAGSSGQNGAGPGQGQGQGGDGAPKEQSLPERMSRLEGAYRHLATKADLERGLSKLGTELRGEMHALDTNLRKVLTSKIDGVKDDLSEKIEAQGKELAGISAQLKTLIWVVGLGVVFMGGLVGALFTLALRLPQ